MDFGRQLREWRSHRNLSQLDLAMEAGISSRHLSFLETGRSRPTEGMIIRIAEALDLTFKVQNELFAAAGFAPRFASAEKEGIGGLPKPVREALRLVLDRHAPWPAIVFDADHDILSANAGFAALGSALGIAAGAGANILGLVVESGPAELVLRSLDGPTGIAQPGDSGAQADAPVAVEIVVTGDGIYVVTCHRPPGREVWDVVRRVIEVAEAS